MTCAFITILYPLTVFQSTAAEIQPDKNQLCTYKVHFVKKRKTSSKLCRRDDANIAVQSLFLNRLIVCSLQLEDISKQTASGGGIFKVSPDCHPSFSPKGFHHFVVTILLFFKKTKQQQTLLYCIHYREPVQQPAVFCESNTPHNLPLSGTQRLATNMKENPPHIFN